MLIKDDLKKIFLIPIGLIAVGVLFYATHWGIGTSPDSAAYIGAARNLLKGLGFCTLHGNGQCEPITGWPPLYPALLSLIGFLGIDPLDGARSANAGLFACNVMLVGFLVYRYTRSVLAGLCGSLLMLTSIDMLQVHSMAWSESLFILMSFTGLFFLASYLENGKRRSLIAFSVFIALALLTRYAGIVLVFTGVMALFFMSEKPFSRRAKDAGIFFVISCLPIALWLMRNISLAGDATTRTVSFHSMDLGRFKLGFDVSSRWLFPSEVPFIIRAGILSILIVVLLCFSIYSWMREKKLSQEEQRQRSLKSLPYVLIGFILFFIFLLVVSILFLDAAVPFEVRILSPVFVAGLVAFLCIMHKVISLQKKGGVARGFLLACLGVLTISYGVQGVNWVCKKHVQGQGFSTKEWRQSEIITMIKDLPSNILIYTNDPSVIYVLTGRPAVIVPEKWNNRSSKPNDAYLSDISRMQERLKEERGILAYLNNVKWRKNRPTEEELQSQLPLQLLNKASDGAIYTVGK